jgi:hypothetical protein
MSEGVEPNLIGKTSQRVSRRFHDITSFISGEEVMVNRTHVKPSIGQDRVRSNATLALMGAIVALALLSVSCSHVRSGGQNNQLSIEAKGTSTELSMSIVPNKLVKFARGAKFVGVVPRTLEGDDNAPDIELYVIEAPAFQFADFTISELRERKVTPRRITSLAQLARALETAGLGFDSVVVARKVETSVTGGRLTVKDIAANTTVECTCPCNVTFGDGVKYSCE